MLCLCFLRYLYLPKIILYGNENAIENQYSIARRLKRELINWNLELLENIQNEFHRGIILRNTKQNIRHQGTKTRERRYMSYPTPQPLPHQKEERTERKGEERREERRGDEKGEEI